MGSAGRAEALLGKPARLMRLAGPIAYLNRDTSDGRRIEKLEVRGLPLVLAQVPDPPGVGRDGATAVGQIVDIRIVDDVVRAEATMETADPVGTRYGVGIDLADAVVVYVDGDGNEVDIADVMFEFLFDEGPTAVFREAGLMGATIHFDPVWPDAYLEVVGPCTGSGGGLFAAGCFTDTVSVIE